MKGNELGLLPQTLYLPVRLTMTDTLSGLIDGWKISSSGKTGSPSRIGVFSPSTVPLDLAWTDSCCDSEDIMTYPGLTVTFTIVTGTLSWTDSYIHYYLRVRFLGLG